MRLLECKTVEEVIECIYKLYGYRICIIEEQTYPPVNVKDVVGTTIYIAVDKEYVDPNLLPMFIKHEFGHVLFQGAKKSVEIFFNLERDAYIGVIIADFLKEWHVEVNIKHNQWYSKEEINLRSKDLLDMFYNYAPNPRILYSSYDPLIALCKIYDYSIFFLYGKTNLLVKAYRTKGYKIEARFLEKLSKILREFENYAICHFKDFVKSDNYWALYDNLVKIGKSLIKKLYEIYGSDPIRLMNVINRDPLLKTVTKHLLERWYKWSIILKEKRFGEG